MLGFIDIIVSDPFLSLRRWLHSQGKFVSCSPHNLLLENTPFCKWISQPDPDKISPSSCQLSNDRFQLEEKLIFYEVLHEFCFDLSEWSQNLGLGTLLWGTQCLPLPSVWLRLLDLAVATTPGKNSLTSLMSIQGSLYPRPGVVFEPHTSVMMPALQMACCLKPAFPVKVPACRD